LSSQAVSLKPNHPIPVLCSTHGQERSENFQSENLQEQQSGRTMFGHRSSMIYTAAPARDMLNRKISKSLVKAKSDVQSVCSKWGGARGEIPGREEGENIPQKVDAQTVSQFQSEIQELKQQLWEKDILLESIAQDSPCQIQEIEDLKQQLREKDSQIEEIAYKKSQNTQQLQTELEELKQKLYDSDRVLEQAVKRSNAEIAISKASRDRDVKELEAQVEELQQELWEENRLVQAAQLELTDKEHELEKIQSLLEQFEMDMIERDSQAENIAAEVNELRSQVLKLRFQLDVVDTSSTMDAIQSDWATDDENNQLVCLTGQEMEQLIPPMSRDTREQKEKIDLSRRQYLAAIIAARVVSSEELLVLVGELRKQLQAFLTEPSLIDSFV
jgi:chromosome segregation ATPase